MQRSIRLTEGKLPVGNVSRHGREKEPESYGARLTSKEVMKALSVSSCELSHLRQAGALPFVKQGNAYMYDTAGVERYLIDK